MSNYSLRAEDWLFVVSVSARNSENEQPVFRRPIINSPYEYPREYWELDESGQPTGEIIHARRKTEFLTPVPKPRKQKGRSQQRSLGWMTAAGIPEFEVLAGYSGNRTAAEALADAMFQQHTSVLLPDRGGGDSDLALRGGIENG